MINKIIRTFFPVFIGLIPLMGSVYGQVLKIGDTVPDFEINDVIGYSSSTIHLSDFEGKAIILDFWSHGCKGCIESFPKVDSLQQKYGDNLQIILVNNESRDSTERWRSKRTGIKLPSVPIVTGGGPLSAAFPQNAYPLHVWIDADRVVKHITHGWNATEANIEAFINRDTLNLSTVEFIDIDQEEIRSTQRIYDAMVDSAVSFSYLARYRSKKDINPGNHLFVHKNGKWRFSVTSNAVEGLFKTAYIPLMDIDLFPKNAVIYEMENTLPYRIPKDKALIDFHYQNYLYTYDYVREAASEAVFREAMAEDLMNKFNLEVTVQERKIPCMVLKMKKTKQLESKGGQSIDSLYAVILQMEVKEPKMRNIPFATLVHRLRARMKITRGMALLDESDFKGNIDIDLSPAALQAKDNKLLIKELEEYGLVLKEEKRKQTCLVFKERE